MSYQHGTDFTRIAREDCIARAGKCGRDCPNALESMGWRCAIKWDQPDVIAALGKPKEPKPEVERDRTERPLKPGRAARAQCCQECGSIFKRIAKAKFCEACSKAKARARKQQRDQREHAIKRAEHEALVAVFGGLSAEEICGRFGITALDLRRWRDLVNPIPSRTIGGRAYYNPGEVERWLEAREARKKPNEELAAAMQAETGRGKITPAVAWVMLDLLDRGVLAVDIARQVGVHPSIVRDVKLGIRHPDVLREWQARRKQAG